MADDARARRTRKATAAGSAKKAAKKAAPVKATVKKAAAKRAAGSAPAPRTATGRATVKRTAAKAPVKATAGRAGARKAAAVKAEPAARTARRRGAVLAGEPRKPPLRLAAEQTFGEDPWQPAEPEPPREDPHARVRAVLRAAAARIEGREGQADSPAATAVPPPAPVPTPAPPAAVAADADEPVTRVLVAPAPLDDDQDLSGVDVVEDEELVDLDELDKVDEDDGTVMAGAAVGDEVDFDLEEEGEWSPPEVLEDDTSPLPSPTTPRMPPPPPRSDSPPPPPPPTYDAPAVVITPPPAPPEKKRGKGKVLLLLLLVLLVVGGGVAAYLLLSDRGIDYSKLEVGDCFTSSASNEVRGIEVQPCSKPHNSEIFFLVTHPAGPNDPYPGKDALVQFAADACLGQPLTEYLGVPLEQSTLKDFEIVPQESAWKDGRRVLVCGLDTGGQGQITGSVKGTRR